MGKADIAVKNWLSDRERFADLFNGTVFGGRQVVLPEELEDMDRETDIIITDKGEKEHGVQRYRDLVKRWNHEILLAVLACEIQDKTHYAMPVRNMLQDSLTYTDRFLLGSDYPFSSPSISLDASLRLSVSGSHLSVTPFFWTRLSRKAICFDVAG